MLRPARQTHRVGAVLARISGLAEEPAPQMALARTSAEADAHNRVAQNSHRPAERRSRPVHVHAQMAIGLLPLLRSGALDRQFTRCLKRSRGGRDALVAPSNGFVSRFDCGFEAANKYFGFTGSQGNVPGIRRITDPQAKAFGQPTNGNT